MVELPLVAFGGYNSDAIENQAVDVDKIVRSETTIAYELLLWDRNCLLFAP
jgi:hypothetical protein